MAKKATKSKVKPNGATPHPAILADRKLQPEERYELILHNMVPLKESIKAVVPKDTIENLYDFSEFEAAR